MPELPIYLDYNATTPLDPAVFQAMVPYLEVYFGNPSSGHAYGRRAREAVDCAREQTAFLLGCPPVSIVFTGGGSEANNLAIKGVAFGAPRQRNHIITSAIEHPSVSNVCRFLERHLGFEVSYLPVDAHGQVDPELVARTIGERTGLITIMHANNEIGTIQPIAEIARAGHARGVLVHTDASQSVGKVPVDVEALGVDLLTVAAHKLYGPKGVGALYVRPELELEPLVHGAGHEHGRRAGTENVAGIVGLGTAAEVARNQLPFDQPRLQGLRDRLQALLERQAGPLHLNGHPEQRLPNTLNLRFEGVSGEELLARTPEVAASTGSACHADQTDPSPVLLALGLSPREALEAVRLSLGRWTATPAIEGAAEALGRGVRALRGSQ